MGEELYECFQSLNNSNQFKGYREIRFNTFKEAFTYTPYVINNVVTDNHVVSRRIIELTDEYKKEQIQNLGLWEYYGFNLETLQFSEKYKYRINEDGKIEEREGYLLRNYHTINETVVVPPPAGAPPPAPTLSKKLIDYNRYVLVNGNQILYDNPTNNKEVKNLINYEKGFLLRKNANNLKEIYRYCGGLEDRNFIQQKDKHNQGNINDVGQIFFDKNKDTNKDIPGIPRLAVINKMRILFFPQNKIPQPISSEFILDKYLELLKDKKIFNDMKKKKLFIKNMGQSIISPNKTIKSIKLFSMVNTLLFNYDIFIKTFFEKYHNLCQKNIEKLSINSQKYLDITNDNDDDDDNDNDDNDDNDDDNDDDDGNYDKDSINKFLSSTNSIYNILKHLEIICKNNNKVELRDLFSIKDLLLSKISSIEQINDSTQ